MNSLDAYIIHNWIRVIFSSFVPDASSKTSCLCRYIGMSLSLPNTSESHGTTIGLSLLMSASWCNAPRGSSKDIGIFIGWCGAVQATKCWPGALEVLRDGGSCASEVCGTVALVVGEDEGWPEKVKARRRNRRRWRSLHNEEIRVF